MINKSELYKGYRAVLDGQEYQFIAWPYGLVLLLDRSNKKIVHCRDCKRQLQPGEGIYQKCYCQNGYICLEAARKIILTVGNYENEDYGFTINMLGSLQKCRGDYGQGKYTSQQVADSIKKKDGGA